MSDATKAKLIKMGLAPDVADKLDKAGLTLPIQIKQAAKADLEAAGLKTSEITKLHQRLPEFSAAIKAQLKAQQESEQ